MDNLAFDAEFLRRLERLRLRVRRGLANGASGERKSQQLGHGMEFADRRAYTPGDDIRHLDWNVLARLDEPVVRLYQRDASTPVHILIDTSASMMSGDPSKFLPARQLAAGIAYVSLCEMDSVSISYLKTDTCEISRPHRGRAAMLLLMQELGKAQARGKTALSPAARSFLAQARRGGRTFLLSDFYDLQGATQCVASLRQHRHEVSCLQILARDDYEPQFDSTAGTAQLIDIEDNDAPALQTGLSRDLMRAFSQAHEAFCAELAQYCRQKQASYTRLDCSDSLENMFLKLTAPGGIWG